MQRNVSQPSTHQVHTFVGILQLKTLLLHPKTHDVKSTCIRLPIPLHVLCNATQTENSARRISCVQLVINGKLENLICAIRYCEKRHPLELNLDAGTDVPVHSPP